MKKRILIVLGILIAAGAIGGGVWYYYNGSKGNRSGDNIVYVSTISSLTESSSGITNRFAGVVEPQETVAVQIESGRKVKEVQVKTGEEVKKGQLLFEYDLSSIQEDLQKAQLDLDRLKNEAMSLSEQINTLTAEKKKVNADAQLSYTIEIETNKMNLKKNEYDQKSKQAEIEKLQNATGNTEVRSEIDGVIKKIDTSKLSSDDGDTIDDSMSGSDMSYGGDNSENSAFITILSTGAYRIKGKVNEQNRYSITPGEPVIIRSRVDGSQIWKGIMGKIDDNNGSTDSNENMNYGMMSSSDDQTNSTSYPFYVELESSEGLMLGQHVYIERDEGQTDTKDGLWLSDYYIVDADTEDPYVWAANENGRLEKRYVILGKHDEEMFEYEIVDGLTEDDCIAFPNDTLEEGAKTEVGDISQTMGVDSGLDYDELSSSEDGFSDEEMMPESMDGHYDMNDEMVSDVDGGMSDSSEFIQEDENLTPMDGAPGSDTGTGMEGIEE